jgi:hypothetical protein
MPAGALRCQARGWLRILSSRMARGPFILAGGVIGSRSSLSHWAAGGSVQRMPPAGSWGGRLKILCSELAREPLVVVVR